jgi:hypothetical protein
MSVRDEVALQAAGKTMRIGIRFGRRIVIAFALCSEARSRNGWLAHASVMKVSEAYEERVRHQTKQRERIRSRPLAANYCEPSTHY